MASNSDVVNKKCTSSISDHLKCPICLEVFKSPRALACLHTFCQTCIQSCITTAAETVLTLTSIKCPVCRIATPAPKPKDPPSEWARELPLNFIIATLIESLGSESESRRLCDNCSAENRSTPATSFCSQCDQFQCVDCLNLHNKLSALKTHSIVGVGKATRESMPSVNLGKIEYCQEHTDEKLKFYCKDHEALCCNSCAIANHRPCLNFVELAQVGRDVKLGERQRKLLETMENLQQQLAIISKHLETNVVDFDKQAAGILKEVKNVRDRVVRLFDNLVSNVSSECSKLKRKKKEEMVDKITCQSSIVAAIASSRTFLESVLKQGTDSQTYIAVNKMESQLEEYERQVNDESQATSRVEFPIRLKLDKVVEAVLNAEHPLASVIKEYHVKPKDKGRQAEKVSVRADIEVENYFNSVDITGIYGLSNRSGRPIGEGPLSRSSRRSTPRLRSPPPPIWSTPRLPSPSTRRSPPGRSRPLSPQS